MKKLVVIVFAFILVFNLYKLTGSAFAEEIQEVPTVEEAMLVKTNDGEINVFETIQKIIEIGSERFERGSAGETHVYKDLFGSKYEIYIEAANKHESVDKNGFFYTFDSKTGEIVEGYYICGADNWIGKAYFNLSLTGREIF